MQWKLFWVFFKIGAFTFGGGYAMIPLIQDEVVEKKKWLKESEFIDLLAIAQSFPGPLALNTAIIVGNKYNGIKGSLITSFAIALPSFVVILIIAILFAQYRHDPIIERIFLGIRPAVVGLIAAPLFRMGKSAGVTFRTIWIPIVVALLVWLVDLSPIYLILIAIVAGLLLKRKKR